MFESGAGAFRDAGVQVGAQDDPAEAREQELLDAFPIDARSEALDMSRLYSVLYCLENSARQFIEQRLQEEVGTSWWEDAVPQAVRRTADSRRADAQNNSWMEAENDGQMSFVDFGGLSKIVVESWEHFSDIIPSQQWLNQRFDEMERARNAIAHNRLLSENEFQRLYMYVRDWVRQVS